MDIWKVIGTFSVCQHTFSVVRNRTETSSNLHYQKLTILALIFLKFAGLKEEHTSAATTLWIICHCCNACHWTNKPATSTTMMKLEDDIV